MTFDIVLRYGLLALAYLLGSIPFSVILGTKLKGIDVRKHGSGNPGGTNSFRFLGKKIGFYVVLLDGLKSGLLVLLLTHTSFLSSYDLFHPLAYGLAATVGHVFSIYIGFKGGKAVACTVGMIIGYNIFFALIMCAVFFLTLKIWKYVSISSTSAVFTALIIALVVQDYNMLIYFGAIFLIVVYRHQKNYNNIKNGVEPKVSWM